MQDAYTEDRGNGPDEDIVQFNLEILDWVAVTVGAHEFECRLRDRLTHRAGLHQDWRREVAKLLEADFREFGAFCGMPARR